jgi:phospholipase/carboxylesterase
MWTEHTPQRTAHTPDRSGTGDALTRRGFVRAGAAGLAAIVGVPCRSHPAREGAMERETDAAQPAARPADGRLAARPRTPTRPAEPGLHALGLAPRGGAEAGRDALLYVPAGHRADRPAPLAVMLHGAGGTAEHGMALLRGLADAAGLVLLAPASRRPTWDAIMGGFGPDVAFVDRALAEAFARCAVDPGRVAAGGFSDGASYALSLGLTNGDLFTHVVAFAPGFVAPGAPVGRPRCYVAHGTRDQVLPIDACSRRIVPRLERAGYAVRYREFDGPHTVPADVAREGVDWFTGAGGAPG